MNLQILDLDGSLPLQQGLMGRYRPALLPARSWGPRLRLACGFARFRRFERVLKQVSPKGPAVTLYGSGDFHHVSLALVRQIARPFNLLVLDNHPDWMRGVPFLHCGTWLNHAARLPLVHRVFHVGGDVDFDNAYRWMAPWRLLYDQKIIVLPSRRRFCQRPWTDIAHEPVRPKGRPVLEPGRIEKLLYPWRAELARRPLYISLDKDVMPEKEAVVNWDSGHLKLEEVWAVLQAFLHACGEDLAGMDLVGDWSPVVVQGWLRRLSHLTEHPSLKVNPGDATCRNQETNLILLDRICSELDPPKPGPLRTGLGVMV